MIHEQLRALRKRTPLSIRAVAEALGFEAHSKYAYYESPRFKGPLPMGLVRGLVDLWAPFGVHAREIYGLAGYTKEDAALAEYDDYVEQTDLKFQMQVSFPPFQLMKVLFYAIDRTIDRIAHFRSQKRYEATADLFPTAMETLLEDMRGGDPVEPGYPDRLAERLIALVGPPSSDASQRPKASNDDNTLGGTG